MGLAFLAFFEVFAPNPWAGPAMVLFLGLATICSAIAEQIFKLDVQEAT